MRESKTGGPDTYKSMSRKIDRDRETAQAGSRQQSDGRTDRQIGYRKLGRMKRYSHSGQVERNINGGGGIDR